MDSKTYFEIIQNNISNGNGIFTIKLNPENEVYEGHFPNEPISPGVCNINTIKECAEKIIERKLFLHNLKQCKFLSLITPAKQPTLDISISTTALDENNFNVVAKVYKEDIIFMELKAEMKITE